MEVLDFVDIFRLKNSKRKLSKINTKTYQLNLSDEFFALIKPFNLGVIGRN